MAASLVCVGIFRYTCHHIITIYFINPTHSWIIAYINMYSYCEPMVDSVLLITFIVCVIDREKEAQPNY